jgi:23S rRNA pseudouridine2604 synthase
MSTGGDSPGTSLNKYISDRGICSRREADQWIEEGRVAINGIIARKGNRVLEGDEVLLDGKPLGSKRQALYLLLNKPRGIVCTTDRREPNNVIDFIQHPERLFPVGRLDKASEGLLLLTNDGDIVNKILRAGNKHEKEYLVTVKQKITENFIMRMSSGIPILGTMTLPCRVEALTPYSFRIVLIQGLNRQIRRMCEYLGYEVSRLQRIRIMQLELGSLPIGSWRLLKPWEIAEIQKKMANSSKTPFPSLDPNKGKKAK